MQKHSEITKLIFILSTLFLLVSCQENDFDALIKRSRALGIDQVNKAGQGLPFFTETTLTPVWETTQKIVRVPDFQLTDQNGNQAGRSLLKDKITFVGFFFASCRGFCPALVQNIKRIEAEIKGVPEAQFLILTVDPEHDQVSVLKEYARKNKISHWSLLTGNQSTIYSLARETFANQAFRRNTDGSERNFVHSENVYVIDQSLRLRAVMNANRVGVQAEALKVALELSTSRPTPIQASHEKN